MSDEIKKTNKVAKDGWGYHIKCQHCENIMTTDANDLSEVEGIYVCQRCHGWNSVGDKLKLVDQL